MSRQPLNLGSAPDAGDGDDLRAACDKINDNFIELYSDKFDKSGGVLSGSITLADVVDSLLTGEYPLQMMSGVREIGHSVEDAYIFDTVNTLNNDKSTLFAFKNNGVDLLKGEFVDVANLGWYTAKGISIPDSLVIGEASLATTALGYGLPLLNAESTTESPLGTTPYGALQFTTNINAGAAGVPAGVYGTVNIDGSANNVAPSVMVAELTSSSPFDLFDAPETDLRHPSCFKAIIASTITAGTLNKISGYSVPTTDTLYGTTPTDIYGFSCGNIGSSAPVNAYAFYTKGISGATNNHAIVLENTGKGAGITFGLNKEDSIYNNGTDLEFSTLRTIDFATMSTSTITTETPTDYITIKVGGIPVKLAIVS